MIEQAKETKPRRKLLIMAVSIVTILAIAIPLAVAGQGTTSNLQGFYFAKVRGSGTDIDGVRTNFPHRYVGIAITNNTTEAGGLIQGYLVGFNATSVKGAKAQGGTSTYTAEIDARRNRQTLEFATNSVNATETGTLGVFIPRYCEGIAADDDGTIEGGEVELVEGWNSLNITRAGAIDVAVWMSFSGPMGEMVGVVGEGTAARFVIYATDMVTELEDVGDVLVGVDEARLITGTTTFVVGAPASGNITVYMPYGTEGKVDATDCTVRGVASVTLVEGNNTILVENVSEQDEGEITFTIQSLVSFHWSGRVTGRAGDYRLSGHFNWYNRPEHLVLSGSLRASWSTLNALLL